MLADFPETSGDYEQTGEEYPFGIESIGFAELLGENKIAAQEYAIN